MFIKQECFQYTHYPIRFNRKTKKIYLFHRDGTVLAVPWREVHFTRIGDPVRYNEYLGIGILVLRKKKTRNYLREKRVVLECVPLPWMILNILDYRGLYAFFEFIRVYMTGTDAQVAKLVKQIDYAPDIIDRRESFGEGFGYMYAHCDGGYPFQKIWSFPIILPCSIGRWIAMHTCKVPRWPEEVEQECQFEPDDPNLRDAWHLSQPGEARRPW
jgi:hypothetical protein